MTEEPQPMSGSLEPTAWVDAPVHRSIASHELMAGERVITASDKLILTK